MTVASIAYHIENGPTDQLPMAFNALVQRLVSEELTTDALTALDDYNPEAAAIFAEKMRPFMNDAPTR